MYWNDVGVVGIFQLHLRRGRQQRSLQRSQGGQVRGRLQPARAFPGHLVHVSFAVSPTGRARS